MHGSCMDRTSPFVQSSPVGGASHSTTSNGFVVPAFFASSETKKFLVVFWHRNARLTEILIFWWEFAATYRAADLARCALGLDRWICGCASLEWAVRDASWMDTRCSRVLYNATIIQVTFSDYFHVDNSNSHDNSISSSRKNQNFAAQYVPKKCAPAAENKATRVLISIEAAARVTREQEATVQIFATRLSTIWAAILDSSCLKSRKSEVSSNICYKVEHWAQCGLPYWILAAWKAEKVKSHLWCNLFSSAVLSWQEGGGQFKLLPNLIYTNNHDTQWQHGDSDKLLR